MTITHWQKRCIGLVLGLALLNSTQLSHAAEDQPAQAIAVNDTAVGILVAAASTAVMAACRCCSGVMVILISTKATNGGDCIT